MIWIIHFPEIDYLKSLRKFNNTKTSSELEPTKTFTLHNLSLNANKPNFIFYHINKNIVPKVSADNKAIDKTQTPNSVG